MGQQNDTKGLAAACAAYGLWGVFPLYFHLLRRSSALEIVAHRIIWTLVLCVVVIGVVGGWAKVRRALGERGLVGTLLGAGVLVSANWLIYIYAVLTDRVVDGALGYFINPLVTVALALIFLRERLSRLQVVALVIGLAAVVVIVVGLGRPPWIGLGLALTFGLYSLAKHRVGLRTTPVIGLGIEVLGVAPASLGLILVLEFQRAGSFTSVSGWYGLLLAGTGIVTAVPLLLFAVGAARLPLVSLAFIQYIAPVLQFLVGVVVFREHMPAVRWAGFVLVWVALVVLGIDTVRRTRARP